MINRKLISLRLKKTCWHAQPQCLNGVWPNYTPAPPGHTPSLEAWEQPDTPFTVRIWIFTAKKVGAILTHAFINTFSNMPGDGDNTAHSKQHSLGLGYILAHHATTKLYALQQHVFVCWSSHTLSQHSTGWLPSVEKTALPEIQPKNAVSSTQKQQPLPKGGKKTQQNYFLNYSQEVTKTYLVWKSQESLRSPALYVKWSSHTKTWPTEMGNPSAT